MTWLADQLEDAMADRLNERQRRTWLALSGVAWSVIGVCYVAMTDARRWYPDLTGVLFLGAALFSFVLAARPASELAYRAAGSFAVAALLVRLVSITMGLLFASDPDALWTAGASTATTLLVVVLYRFWWIARVKPWHERHRRQG